MLEIKTARNLNNHYTAEIIVPFRPRAYKDDFKAIENDPNIKIENKLWPVGITMGYHFGL